MEQLSLPMLLCALVIILPIHLRPNMGNNNEDMT